MNARTAIATLTLAALTTTGAHAAISSVAGMTTWVTSPSGNCGLGGMPGFNASAWDEKQTVGGSFFADQTNNGPDSGAIPGTIGGLFDSHFIHWEPLPGAIGAFGSVTYNNPIVGVMFTANSLDLSDNTLGHPNVTYPTLYTFRGIGGFPPSTINVVGNTIHFNFQSFAPNIQVVQVRVLTRVPAPGSLSLLGLSGLVATRRRRR